MITMDLVAQSSFRPMDLRPICAVEVTGKYCLVVDLEQDRIESMPNIWYLAGPDVSVVLATWNDELFLKVDFHGTGLSIGEDATRDSIDDMFARGYKEGMFGMTTGEYLKQVIELVCL